jgi:hypothetical protein
MLRYALAVLCPQARRAYGAASARIGITGAWFDPESNRAKPPDEGRFVPESEPRRTKIAPLGQSPVAPGAHLLAQSGCFSSPSFSLGGDSRPKNFPRWP